MSLRDNSEFMQQDGKALVCDNRDRAITCMFCCDDHLTLCFLVFYKHTCLKKGEVGPNVCSNKVTVMPVTQGFKVYRLPSSPVLSRKFTNDGLCRCVSTKRTPAQETSTIVPTK